MQVAVTCGKPPPRHWSAQQHPAHGVQWQRSDHGAAPPCPAPAGAGTGLRGRHLGVGQELRMRCCAEPGVRALAVLTSARSASAVSCSQHPQRSSVTPVLPVPSETPVFPMHQCFQLPQHHPSAPVELFFFPSSKAAFCGRNETSARTRRYPGYCQANRGQFFHFPAAGARGSWEEAQQHSTDIHGQAGPFTSCSVCSWNWLFVFTLFPASAV